MNATAPTLFDQMTYGAIVPYYGSKRTLAPKIVEVIGPHRCYWSLFCGSLAVGNEVDGAGRQAAEGKAERPRSAAREPKGGWVNA